MQGFEDAERQGGFLENPDGSMTDWGGGAMRTLDSQSLIKGPLGMAYGATKHFSGVESITDWKNVGDRMDTLKTNLGSVDAMKSNLDRKAAAKIVVGDPLKWLVGTLVEFLVQTFQPLEDLLGVVTGNEGRMHVSADMWQTVADAMPPISEHMNSVSEECLGDWVGETGSTARARIAELGLMVDCMGYLAMGMEQILRMMAGVAKLVRRFVQALITEGVVWVIERIAPQIAASIATFGAAAPVCIAMTVAKIAGLVLDAIMFVQEAVRIAQRLVDLLNMIQEIFSILWPYVSKMINVPSFTTA